ncbi:MAG TPA: hypothetical protein VL588_03615 [Bdellovibrionota bacterium]|jgi:hypothetical protein|nr:hypothetical protein [Bdellovibrionota bacterium]
MAFGKNQSKRIVAVFAALAFIASSNSAKAAIEEVGQCTTLDQQGHHTGNFVAPFAACQCNMLDGAALDPPKPVKPTASPTCIAKADRIKLMKNTWRCGVGTAEQWPHGCPTGQVPSVIPTTADVANGCPRGPGAQLKVYCVEPGADTYADLDSQGVPHRNNASTVIGGQQTGQSKDLNDGELAQVSDGTDPQSIMRSWKGNSLAETENEDERNAATGADGKAHANSGEIATVSGSRNTKGNDGSNAHVQGLLDGGMLDRGKTAEGYDAHRQANIDAAGNANSALGYASADTTKGMQLGITVGSQASDAAGAQIVQTTGQIGQLEANAPGKTQSDVYKAAADTADNAAIAQTTTAGVNLVGTGVMIWRALAHSHDKGDAADGAKAVKSQIDSSAASGGVYRNHGEDGKSAGDGYIDTSSNSDTTFAKAFKGTDGVYQLNQGYDMSKADASRCGSNDQAMDKVMNHLDQYAERWHFTQDTHGRWVDEQGLEVNRSHPRVRDLATNLCMEQNYQHRMATFNGKKDSMKTDVSRIAAQVTEEQNKGIDAATQGIVVNTVQALAHGGQAIAQHLLADKLRELANDNDATAKDAPVVDTNFDPLAFNEGTGTGNTGSIVGNGSTGQFAAGAEDDKAGDEKAPDLGPGLNTGPLGNDVGKGPEAGGFAAGDGGGKGGGSGVGGLDGASTSAATADKGADPDAAQYADMSGRGAGYGTGSTFAASAGGRRGKGGGNNGIDLNSLLGQLLPGKGDEKKDSILDYGGRGPAGGADSFLDRNVNIFERIHDAYQDRGRKGVVGF